MDKLNGGNDAESTYESLTENTAKLPELGMFLADISQLVVTAQWDVALNTCDYALRFYPHNEQLNCYKLMIKYRVTDRAALRNLSAPFDSAAEFREIMNGNDEALKKELSSIIAFINNRIENDRCDAIYRLAVREMNTANTPEKYEKAAGMFGNILNYSNAAVLAEKCRSEAEKLGKNRIYAEAKSKMDQKNLTDDAYIEELQKARNLFLSISGWMDADMNAEFCLELAGRTKNRQELKRQTRRRTVKKIRRRTVKLVSFLIPLILIIGAAVFCWKPYIYPGCKYLQAEQLMKENRFLAAAKIYDELDGFSDSTQKIAEAFKKELAVYVEADDVDGAKSIVDTAAKYKISSKNLIELEKNYRMLFFSNAEVGDEIYFGTYEQTEAYNGKESVKWIVLDKTDNELLLISAYVLNNFWYYYDDQEISWVNSSLRNKEDSLFSLSERSVFAENYTDALCFDEVYALSKEEAQKYSHILKAKVTEYAYENGAYVNSSGYGEWWLRNPETSRYSYYVDSDGEIQRDSVFSSHGWRPVVKVVY